MKPTGPTLDEIRRWPATVSVELAAAAFGISRAHAYESIKASTFPARSLKVGRRTVVLTASILAALDPPALRETA
ncbi:AlpA family phage regulatory protein [Solwaraspora sp. WMMD792]|uniref:AlpA family phage regulatory protein n=1 Tax=Solwaraspora sp. WMMD792 TaxID=3016099 RepID=UPI00241678E4|nr:AlpA family phage regulatory protein [Solwaraspora sp. WMMD792]MDG4770675.1 AlpA family phage regulatory protein [Solwaraspora sp. WMMD792]